MYLDIYTSYIISVCKQKIKNPDSAHYQIFPDKTAFPECVKLYESWKNISIEKSLIEADHWIKNSIVYTDIHYFYYLWCSY